MLTVLKIFFRAPGTNSWLVLLCLVLASLAEGFGIASLLPLIATLTEAPDAEPSAFHQQILDIFDTLGLPKEFEAMLLLVVGFTLLKGVLLLFAMRYVGYAGALVATKLRMQILQSTLRAHWSYFVSQPVGRVTNAMGAETNGAVIAFRTAADFLMDSIQTVAYLTLAFLMSWKLTLAAIAAGGVILLSLHFLVAASRRAGYKATERMRKVMIRLNDVLSNIKPLKAMARHEASRSYMEKNLLGLKRAMQKQVSSVVFLKRLQEMMIALALAAGLYVAVKVLNSDLAELLVMVVVIMRVIKNLARIQRQYQLAAGVEAPYRAVQELLEQTRSVQEKLHGGQDPVFERSCQARNLEFSYGDTGVLNGLSLEIPSRGVTVLMGTSGAGKTTFTDVLLGFYEPKAGEILLDGVPLAKVDLRKWREMIGYVPQELQLLHDSILANVTLGDPAIGEEQVREALAKAEALDFVAALPDGIHSVVGERGSQLSGGQRQRIALARALAPNPGLLILDEVTSALDPATEKEICATLKALSQHTAVLAITHQHQFLEIADRAYRLQQGRAEEIEVANRIAV